MLSLNTTFRPVAPAEDCTSSGLSLLYAFQERHKNKPLWNFNLWGINTMLADEVEVSVSDAFRWTHVVWQHAVEPIKSFSASKHLCPFYCRPQYQSSNKQVSCEEVQLWAPPLFFHCRPLVPACHHSCVTWCIVSVFPPPLKINCSFIFRRDNTKNKSLLKAQ